MSTTRSGIGSVFRPKYRDKETGEWKTQAVYWIQYWRRGKRFRESSKSTKKKVAEDKLKQRLGEIGLGRPSGRDAEQVGFEDLARMILDDYVVKGRRSTKRVELALRHLRGRFAHFRALEIMPDAVTAYVRARQEEGAARATVAYEIAVLKRGLALAVKNGRLAYAPVIEGLRVRNARKGFFEEADFRRVLAELPEHLRPVVQFAYLTGWRIRSEVLPLRWAQVDLKAGVARLEPDTTKNDEGRTFPFDVLPELKALILKQREYTKAVERRTERIVPWVFHNDGERMQSFYKAWHSACRRAATEKRGGLEVVARPYLIGRIPHDFRRTAVRNLVRAGVPERIAMKLTGHLTPEVFARYDIVVEQDLRDGLAKLAAVREASA